MTGNQAEYLREQIENLVVLATGHDLSLTELHECEGSLTAAGVNSIAYVILVEALERCFGIVIDEMTDSMQLTSVDLIVKLVLAHERKRLVLRNGG